MRGISATPPASSLSVPALRRQESGPAGMTDRERASERPGQDQDRKRRFPHRGRASVPRSIWTGDGYYSVPHSLPCSWVRDFAQLSPKKSGGLCGSGAKFCSGEPALPPSLASSLPSRPHRRTLSRSFHFGSACHSHLPSFLLHSSFHYSPLIRLATAIVHRSAGKNEGRKEG